MPTARQRKPKRTKFRNPGHALKFGVRPSVVQPNTPIVTIDATLSAADRDAFLTSTNNVHLDDSNEKVNFQQSGRREGGLPYDVRRG